MKKRFLLLMLLCMSTAYAAGNYPFTVVKSGKGRQVVILIPGFASSGDVWKETAVG